MGKAEVLWVSKYYFKKGRDMEFHAHDYFQIYYFLGGHGEIYIEETCYHFSPGQLFLIQPFQKHRLLEGAKTIIKVFDIKFLVHDPDLLEQVQKTTVPVMIPTKEFYNFYKKNAESGLIKESFVNLLILIFQHQDQQQAEVAEVQNPNELCELIINYLEKNYLEKITLAKIATGLGYNSCYICQIFKKQMKCSPMKYLYRLRINRSKEIIADLNYSMDQVAALSGFESIHHFSQVFKKYEGITPSQWRSQLGYPEQPKN